MTLQTTAARMRDDDTYTVVSYNRWQYPDIPVTTLHLSCESDVYEGPDKNYAGFVLYAHNKQTQWTLNGKRCKTGYIVVKDTESPSVKRHLLTSEGMVHGAVYKSVFGEDVGDTVGEAFAVMQGKLKWNSNTFNAREDPYHDGRREISKVAEKCVRTVLFYWMVSGETLPDCRNYNVEELKSQCIIL